MKHNPDFSDLLLVSDFDRTLTDRASRIPAANTEAIEFFKAHGGLFTMGTGRSVPMFAPYRAGVATNAPLILYNGAACYDYDSGELTEPIWMDTGLELLRYLREEFPTLRLELQGLDAHYFFDEDPARDRFYEGLGVAIRRVAPEQAPIPYLKLALFGEFREPSVAQFFSADEETLAFFQAAAEQIARDWPSLVVDRAAARILDLQRKDANKGAAARRLARRLGRTLICVGDAMNDASMLLEADRAFAPADCDEQVKALGCCTLTRPCGEGAIAGVVELLARERG